MVPWGGFTGEGVLLEDLGASGIVGGWWVRGQGTICTQMSVSRSLGWHDLDFHEGRCAVSSTGKSKEAGPEPAEFLYDKHQTPIFWSTKNKKLYSVDECGHRHDLKLNKPRDGPAMLFMPCLLFYDIFLRPSSISCTYK